MKHNPWLVLAIISGALLMVGVDMTVLNVALPTLSRELNASASDKLWIVNAYPLILGGLVASFGALSDKVGHRRFLTVGMVVFGTASLAAAFSSTPALLIFSRGLLAVGAAMMLPATLSIVRLVFTADEDRAVAIGIWGAVWAGAAALGPVLCGILLENFWWGSVFLINVPIMLVTLTLVILFVPALPGDSRRTWDFWSAGTVTIALIAGLNAVKGLFKPEIHWLDIVVSTAVAAGSGLLFVRRQATQSTPVIDFGLFRNREFSTGFCVAFVAAFVLAGLQFVISQELQIVRSFSPLTTGLFLLPIAAGSFVAAPLVGRILFAIGVEHMVAITLGIATLGLGLYTFSDVTTSALWAIFTLTIIGVGVGAVMAVASTAVMINAPDNQAGMAGSLESIAYEIGGTLGVAVMGSVMALVYSDQLRTPTALHVDGRIGVEQLLEMARGLPGEVGHELEQAARSAFASGAHAALAISVAFTAIMFFWAATSAISRRPAMPRPPKPPDG